MKAAAYYRKRAGWKREKTRTPPINGTIIPQ